MAITSTEQIRGFAFLEFDEKEDASAAIDNYDKTEFMERTIKVRRSKPNRDRVNYHEAIWHKDDWYSKIEQKKIFH